MVKRVARKLKVFQAQFGFYDTVVAAPSQAAALRAWGVHQNLFASGDATLATDEAAIAAAELHPETPLRRAVGGDDPFALEPTSLPKAPNAPKVRARNPAASPRAAAPPKPPADKSELDLAEKAMKALEDGRKRQVADFEREADALEARRKTAQAAYADARKAAKATLAQARAAYRQAGGES